MKRKYIELKRLEWREKSDPQRVVVATLTRCPTDRVNGYLARYTAILANVRRELAASGLVWEVSNPMEAVCHTMLELPKGARYSLSIDADAPSACVP